MGNCWFGWIHFRKPAAGNEQHNGTEPEGGWEDALAAGGKRAAAGVVILFPTVPQSRVSAAPDSTLTQLTIRLLLGNGAVDFDDGEKDTTVAI
jgi:hypothetical protein